MLVLGGIMVLLGGASLVVGDTCMVDGVERAHWEEWKEGCDLCICIEGDVQCTDICEDVVTSNDNPCYRFSGDLCVEYGCYDIWSDPNLTVPEENLPVVPIGDVASSSKTCTCEDGYPYVLCMVS